MTRPVPGSELTSHRRHRRSSACTQGIGARRVPTGRVSPVGRRSRLSSCVPLSAPYATPPHYTRRLWLHEWLQPLEVDEQTREFPREFGADGQTRTADRRFTNAYSSCVADLILARSVTPDAAPSRAVTSSLLHELLHTPADVGRSGQRGVHVTPSRPSEQAGASATSATNAERLSRRQPPWIRRLAARPTAACSRAANRATLGCRQR